MSAWRRLVLTAGILLGLAGCAVQDRAPAARPAGAAARARPSQNVPEADAAAPVPGLFADRILFGQSAAFSGPAQELGRSMQLGIEAAFHEVNRRGGVHGRRLELIALDDYYEPEAAIANTLRLIEQEQVFALIGAVGTPTSRSAVPIAAAAGVPYLAPFTGSAFLRETAWGNIVNLRASYDQETEELVERLTADLGLQRIAVVYQDDSFGRAGYQGTQQALKRRGMAPVAIGLYPRNTTYIKKALLDVRQGEPEAVILVGAYAPVAELIAWARHIGMDPVFVTISFVGSNALARDLQVKDTRNGLGVYVTQVVPFPTDDSVPVTIAYRHALEVYAAADAVPGFVSLEGYLAGRLTIAALERCGPAVSRSCFFAGLHRTDTVSLDGLELQFGPQDNQGSDTVFLTVIGHDGQLHPVRTLQDSIP